MVSCGTITVESDGDGGDGGDGAAVSVRDITITPPSPWMVGDSIDISVIFENTGSSTGSLTRNVLLNGSVVGTASATVEPGATPADTVTASIPNVSSATISVEGTSLAIQGQVEDGTGEPPDGEPPDGEPPDGEPPDGEQPDEIAGIPLPFGLTQEQVLAGGAVAGVAVGAIALSRSGRGARPPPRIPTRPVTRAPRRRTSGGGGG